MLALRVLDCSHRHSIDCTDSLSWLKQLPSDSVHCAITSPPYYGQRDYQVEGQLGLEETPEQYLAGQLSVYTELRRVLHPTGTLWLNIGDSYSSSGRGGNPATQSSTLEGSNRTQESSRVTRGRKPPRGVRPKNLLGIPWRLALMLQASGWNLRSEVIWAKPNAMPESIKDRPSKAHEHVFLFTKKQRYFYDFYSVLKPAKTTGRASAAKGSFAGKTEAMAGTGQNSFRAVAEQVLLRTVWTISVARSKGNHFAVMPKELATRCVLAGTSEHGCCPTCLAPATRIVRRVRKPTRPGTDTKTAGLGQDVVGNRDPQRHVTSYESAGWKPGCTCPPREPIPCVVLDPFAGSGTTLVAAAELGRRSVGCELNPEYAAAAVRRLAAAATLF